jgi:hypothetical protein
METVYKVVVKSAEGAWMTIQHKFNGSRLLPKNSVLNAEPFGFVRDGRTRQSRGFTCFLDRARAEAFRDQFPASRNCVLVTGKATGVFVNPVNPDLGEMAHSVKLIREL